MKKIVLTVIGIVLLIGTVVGGYMFFNSGVNVKGQDLIAYGKSSGGGMNGGYQSVSITRYDDTNALYCTERADWWYEDPQVKEYLMDKKVLEDIRAVFDAERMNRWNDRDFNKTQIMDGATTTYTFRFDQERVRFSSQHFPDKYADKLARISEVISGYTQDMTPLPGLVVPVTEDGEYTPVKDGIGVYVCSYKGNTLSFKIVNDTGDSIDYAGTPVIRAEDGSTVFTGTRDYDGSIYPYNRAELNIKPEDRLQEGTYTLSIGDMECTFEIR